MFNTEKADHGILQIIIVLAVLVLLVKPVGSYVYHVFSNEPNRTDRIFGYSERFIYRLIGLKGSRWHFVKAHTRIFIPTTVLLTLLLVALQVPQTLDPTLTVTTLEGAVQRIIVVQSALGFWQSLFHTSVVKTIVRQGRHMDVLVVADYDRHIRTEK